MSTNIQFSAAHDCSLDKNRIDIWEFPLNIPFHQANSLLNEKEVVRANRYHFERHRRRFTIARATLRLILGRYLQRDASELSFQYSAHGKPGIESSQGLEFNLSHSGELALLAVGCQFPLGVDLEFFSARPYDGIAKNLFSQQELEFFLKLPKHLKPQVFFQIWAQKEAFIKASGLGLSYPTKLFTVPIFSTSPERIIDTVHNCEWLMNSLMPQVACNAALCHHPDVKELRYTRLANPATLF